MAVPVRLLVGLGNPGREYLDTRHNAGFWFVDEVCRRYGGSFKSESRYFGDVATISISGKKIFLLKPSTFMNRSGQSVSSLTKYYDISPDEILVAHDELDLPVGISKLKKGGGHAGHNGLRDIIKAIGTNDFLRLRIGIDRPEKSKAVVDYVLGSPGRDDRAAIDMAMDAAADVVEYLVGGSVDKAMHTLHSV